MMRPWFPALLLATALSAGCHSSGKATHPPSERDAVAAQGRAWKAALLAGDAGALAAMYCEDAVLMVPNQPSVEGRSAIREFFAGFPKVSSCELKSLEVQGRGDLAFAHGAYKMTLVIPGMDPVHDEGKYVEIWRRDADGTWRILRDIVNSDLPGGH